eukprot:7060943-Alexandrium_andersonii.AAC.1
MAALASPARNRHPQSTTMQCGTFGEQAIRGTSGSQRVRAEMLDKHRGRRANAPGEAPVRTGKDR